MNMLDQIIARPWIFFALLAVIAVLSFCAAIRARRDMKLKPRTSVPRRKTPRLGNDRRWDGVRTKR